MLAGVEERTEEDEKHRAGAGGAEQSGALIADMMECRMAQGREGWTAGRAHGSGRAKC